MTDSTPDDSSTDADATTANAGKKDTTTKSTAVDTSASASVATADEPEADTAQHDPADTENELDEDPAVESAAEPAKPTKRAGKRPAVTPSRQDRDTTAQQTQTLTPILLTVVATVLAIALIASTVTFLFLWRQTSGDLSDLRAEADDRNRAQEVAANYAAGASTFDYRDLGPWSERLTSGVSPELEDRLQATVGAMNQLLQPLQWVSEGTVLNAVVNDHSGSVFEVSAYVSVVATNVQAASGREVITVYNVTLDKDQDWAITDIGGAVTPSSMVTPPAEGETAPAPGPAPVPGGDPAPIPGVDPAPAPELPAPGN